MSDIHDNDVSYPFQAGIDHSISDEISPLHDDETSNVAFGISVYSENSSVRSDDEDDEEESNSNSSADSSSTNSSRRRNDGNVNDSMERGEAISSDDECESSAMQRKDTNAQGNPNALKKSTARELEEGELETDSDGDELPVAEKEQSAQHVEPHRLSFEGCLPPANQPTNLAAPLTAFASQYVGVCRFFMRGGCTWGDECKYYHPRAELAGSSGRQNGGDSAYPRFHHQSLNRLHHSVQYQQRRESPPSSSQHHQRSHHRSQVTSHHHRRRRSSSSTPSTDDGNAAHKKHSIDDERPILDDEHRRRRFGHRALDRNKQSTSPVSSSDDGRTTISNGRHTTSKTSRDALSRQSSDGHRSDRRSTRSQSSGERPSDILSHRRHRHGDDGASRYRATESSHRRIRERDGGRSSRGGRRRSPTDSRRDERRKRRTSSLSPNDIKARRLSTPVIEPISSDSEGTDGTQELRLRSTLGAELRRTTTRDAAGGQKSATRLRA